MSKEQAEHVYEAVENGEQVKPLSVNSSVDEQDSIFNPYTIGLRTNTDSSLKKEPAIEMKKCNLTWSILSTVVDYTECGKSSPYKEVNHSPVYNKFTSTKDLVYDEATDHWQERYEDVSCNLYARNEFDDNNDVSTTYLRYYKSKVEERTFPVDNHIPIDGRGVTAAFLIDNTPMKLFFDSGASRSYLSKKYYDANKSLHKLPKFSTTCTGIKIGNGSIIPTLFVIPVQFMAHGHMFEIYKIVAEIDDGMDLVFGFKNMAETEGRLNTRTGEYDFIGRSIPVYPQNDLDVPEGKQVLIKIKAPFREKLSGRIITKMFGSDKVFTMKIRIENNQGCVQFINKSKDTIKLKESRAIGILDLRSIGYFKVSYQKLIIMAESRQTFKMYHYQQLTKDPKDHLDDYYKMTRAVDDDQYPWLAKDDPRRHQTDAEILYEKIDLKDSALTRKEKTKLMKMILRYREAFSLRDEIGECPNLIADIKVIDESPFFVRPFPLSETEGIDVGDSEEVLDPQIRIPDQSDFEITPPLQEIVDPSKITHKFLPKQGDIDRLIKQINKKVLRDTNLNLNLRDLRAAYLQSPHFRDIYLNLSQNRVPLGKGAAKRLEQNARNYLILDGLFFKIIELEDGRLDTVLCIPTSKVHILLDTYHSSLIGGHSGITKCYHTISQRFYCPNLAENLRAYITGCHICQMFKKGKNFQRPYQKRMNINTPAMTRISMDIKQMPVNRGYSHILVLLCEVSNYMVALPLTSTRTQNILEASKEDI